MTNSRPLYRSASWHGGFFPQFYTAGLPGLPDDDGWILFVNASAPTPPPTPPTPPPPPPLSIGFLISRQNVLMRSVGQGFLLFWQHLFGAGVLTAPLTLLLTRKHRDAPRVLDDDARPIVLIGAPF